jgi:hypothetical protein
MSITKDQLAQLNFGYLSGIDLLQYCPTQILTSQYEKSPETLKNGCDIAYSEIEGALGNQYDIFKELSNANQSFKNQTGNITINIASGSYVSRIFFKWNNPIPVIIDGEASNNALQLFSEGFYPAIQGQIIDASPTVQIGSILNADDIMPNQHIGQNGVVFWLNKIYPQDTVLYVNISSGNVDIEMSANSGIQMPSISTLGLQNLTGSFIVNIPANTYIYQIFGNILLSIPSIQIGTTEGGDDVLISTLVSNAILPITQQYFDVATTLYFLVTNGSVNFRIDLAYNFIAPTPSISKIREMYFVKILSLLAIRNILGSIAGNNEKLQLDFEWADNQIQLIKKKERSLKLVKSPSPLRAKNEIVSSAFKTLG